LRKPWTFGRAFAAVVLLCLWVEVVVHLGASLRDPSSPHRSRDAVLMFLLLVPASAALVYRRRALRRFLGSMKVGVVTFALIGVGAVIGVLFHQEDPMRPTMPGAVEALAARGEGEASGAWSVSERMAWVDYQNFRHAEAYFVYHLLTDLGLRRWLGFTGPPPGESQEAREALARLEEHLPGLQRRFGEEFAVAIRAQSEAGLRNRQINAEIQRLEEEWQDFWWSLFVWADRLDLRRVYRADWFSALWVILFLGVFLNTLPGRWRTLKKPAKWGFAVTHGGVLVLLLGAFLGRFTEQRGILQMHIGDTMGDYLLYGGGVAPLQERSPFHDGPPFRLRLDDFRADYHDVLDVIYAKRGADGGLFPEFELAEQPKLRVFQGLEASYDWGRVGEGGMRPWMRVEVLEHASRARTWLEPRRSLPEEPGLPLASWELAEAPGGAAVVSGLLVTTASGDTGLSTASLPGGVRVRLATFPDRAAFLAAASRPPEERLGELTLPPASEEDVTQTLSVLEGGTTVFHTPDGDYEVEVLRATPSFRLAPGEDGEVDALPLSGEMADALPTNPAVQLAIRGPDGEEGTRWVLEQDVHEQGIAFPDLHFRFRWDSWAAPARERWLVGVLGDGSVLAARVGDPESVAAVGEGGPFEASLLDGRRLRIPEAYAHGIVEVRFEQKPDADFYDEAPPAVRLRVTTPEGAEEFVMVSDPEHYEIFDYVGPEGEPRIVAFRFREDKDGGALPIEWRSKLTVLEQPTPDAAWAPVHHGEIRVNDYMTYGGHRFFQTDASPTDPTYSGIGVVYDPGIPMVVFGLFAVMFGTFAVFLVKPLLTRRHRGLD